MQLSSLRQRTPWIDHYSNWSDEMEIIIANAYWMAGIVLNVLRVVFIIASL